MHGFQVEAFNLLKNTVQKIEVPGPEGSTLIIIGGKLFLHYIILYYIAGK